MIRLFSSAKEDEPLLDTSATPNWPERFVQLATESKDQRLKQFYEASCVAGDTPLKEVPFVALDLETTGLDSQQDQIISVGLVPFTLDRIYCRQSAHWVVNPHRLLNEESVVIHGITDSEVQDAPDLRVILEQVLQALAGKIVVVHYKNIERGFLNQALLKRLGEGIEFPVVDTLDLEAAIQYRQCRGFFNRLKGKKPGSVRLGHARERYGLPTYQPHHALTDALASAELLQAQLAYYFTPNTPISEVWQ